MKRLLYFLAFLAFAFTINACKKGDDPAPVSPAVGSWKLDRIRVSGYVAPYTSLNGDSDPSSYDYQDSFVIKTDDTFTGTLRTSGRVIDYKGNWTFLNNILTVNDDQGGTDNLTLDDTKTPLQLFGAPIATSDSLRNPTTNKGERVKYNLQLVYIKQ